MSVPTDAIETEIEQLESDAEDIEALYTEFFPMVGTHTTSGDFSGGGRFWNTPSGEVEDLQRDVSQKFEIWYNSATPLVSEYLPDRLDDFNEHYSNCKQRIELEGSARSDPQDVINNQNSDFDSMRNIVQSIPSRIHAEELKVRRQISENISQSELRAARNLFDEGEVRASGVIAGVALERYLLMKCENASSEVDFKHDDGINPLSQKLFEADEIGSTPRSHLEHLADIRADCAHANEEDPHPDDVQRLLDDADDYIRGRKI